MIERELMSWPSFDTSAPIIQGFGDNADLYKQIGQDGHNGLDIALPHSSPVLAAASGVIVHAGLGDSEPVLGSAAGLAVLIELEDGSGLVGYAHLSRLYVASGDTVGAGEVIALSGMTGAATGPHLHIELITYPLDMGNGYAGRVDPTPWLDPVLADHHG